MNISLTRFLQTGCFGDICVGSIADKIQARLGPPDGVGKSRRKFRYDDMWLYGGVEFWLDQSEPQACRSIWIERKGFGLEFEFEMPSNTVSEDWDLTPFLPRDAVEAYLQQHEIASFQPTPKKPDKNGYIFAPRKLVIPASGVSLGFDEDWRLNAFLAEQPAQHL